MYVYHLLEPTSSIPSWSRERPSRNIKHSAAPKLRTRFRT